MGLFKKKIVKKTYDREHMKPVIRALSGCSIFLTSGFYLVVFVLFHCYILIDCSYYYMITLLFYLVQVR